MVIVVIVKSGHGRQKNGAQNLVIGNRQIFLSRPNPVIDYRFFFWANPNSITGNRQILPNFYHGRSFGSTFSKVQ